MRVSLVYNSLISNACLSRFVSCSQAYFVPGLRRLTSKRVPNLPSSVLKCFSFRGRTPLTRGSAPVSRWGLRPQAPIIDSRSRARHILSVQVPFLLGNKHWVTEYQSTRHIPCSKKFRISARLRFSVWQCYPGVQHPLSLPLFRDSPVTCWPCGCDKLYSFFDHPVGFTKVK